MTAMTRKYSPAKGATFGAAKAQAYAEFLTSLGGELGELTPEEVVEAAAPEDSPIHGEFEWDDSEAARKFRVHQARNLLNHIKVRIVYDSAEEDDAPLYVNLKVEHPDENRPSKYVPMHRVLTVEDYRKQAALRALEELRHWQKKYRQLSRLTPLIELIETGIQDLEATG